MFDFRAIEMHPAVVPARHHGHSAPLSEQEARVDAIQTVAITGLTKWKIQHLLRERTDWPTPVILLIADFTTIETALWTSEEVSLYFKRRIKHQDLYISAPRYLVPGSQLHTVTGAWLNMNAVTGARSEYIVNEIQNTLLPPGTKYKPYTIWSPRPGGKMEAATFCLRCLLGLLLLPFIIPLMPFYWCYANFCSDRGVTDLVHALCMGWMVTVFTSAITVCIVFGIVLGPEWFAPLLALVPFIIAACFIVIFATCWLELGAMFSLACCPVTIFTILSIVFFTMNAPSGWENTFFGLAIFYTVGAGLSACFSCHVYFAGLEDDDY